MSGKQHKQRVTRATAGGAALLLGVGMLPIGLMSAPAANAAGVGAGLSITADDVKFILEQIQISEAHATKLVAPGGALVAPTSVLDCGTVAIPRPCVTDPTLPQGLRQVSGRQNNLFQNAPVTTAMDAAVAEDLGAADRPFPRLGPVNWRATEAGTFPGVPAAPTTYQSRGVSVQDTQPRVISNLVADQNPTTNAAALAAAGGPALDAGIGALPPGLNNPGNTALILNVPPGGLPAPGQPALAPTSGMFTLFGQFFDHGLDLVGKTSTEVVVIPLDASDPLFVTGGPTNFMLANRTVVDGNLDGVNSTTPWIDQNQTYGSHASKQVFMREFVLNGAGDPVDTGKLLDDAANLGYVANWAETKAQARNVLGINLVDSDVFNVPLILTDEYGNFLPGANGFPQLVVDATPANTADNVTALSRAFRAQVPSPLPTRFGRVTPSSTTSRTTRCRAPGKSADADAAIGLTGPSATNYDDELLDQHFITGDGRGNENIGLTAVHTMFHAEHNRLVDDLDGIINAVGNEALHDRIHGRRRVDIRAAPVPGCPLRQRDGVPARGVRGVRPHVLSVGASGRSRRTTRCCSPTSRLSSPTRSTDSVTRCFARTSSAPRQPAPTTACACSRRSSTRRRSRPATRTPRRPRAASPGA